MERILVFLGALLATLFLIRAIPRMPFVNGIANDPEGRPTMSPAELKFYQVLLQCIPAGYEVWAKANLNQYSSTAAGCVDFLLTYGSERVPALVIDFDEETPLGLRPNAPSTSSLGGLPILRIPMAGEYAPVLVRAKIMQFLVGEERRAA